MKPLRSGLFLLAALGIVALFIPSSLSANDLGVISGQVRDAGGTPLVGALVVAAAAVANSPEKMVFTDNRGAFTIPNLFAGEYSIRVTLPTFLPAVKRGIRLNAGSAAMLTVNLQNALDIVRRVVTRDNAMSEDILWTLRSSRATQPVLHLVEEAPIEQPFDFYGPDYSGYFQVYSKSVETLSGTTEAVGSHFSVTMPLDTTSKVTIAGQYSEVPTQPRGIGASYEFSPRSRHRAVISLNARQGGLAMDSRYPGSLKELRMEYDEQFQWSDHLVFNYGAEVGRAETIAGRSYLRPRFEASWVPEARTTVSIGASTQAPAAVDDPIRGKEYFDRNLYVPPTLERYAHSEAELSHILSDGMLQFSAGLFRDRSDAQALFVNSADGRQGILVVKTQQNPTRGFRLHVGRQFSDFEAGLGFTAGDGAGFAPAAQRIDGLGDKLVQRRFQSLTARLKTDFDATQTEITAVYRWMSGFSVSQLDAYQRFVEYNDPTLSLTVAQGLPMWRMFPGKLQAILDARNLFEQSFDINGSQVAHSPRLLKGGINIKF